MFCKCIKFIIKQQDNFLLPVCVIFLIVKKSSNRIFIPLELYLSEFYSVILFVFLSVVSKKEFLIMLLAFEQIIGNR